MNVAVYDTKSYDREYLTEAAGGDLTFHFFEFRLSADTAPSAAGCDVVCVFVTDRIDRACVEALAAL
jgi:D-lactate dehydrogenase